MLAGIGSAIALVLAAFRKGEPRGRGSLGEPRGQTDLEFLVEKILNRSGPNVLR